MYAVTIAMFGAQTFAMAMTLLVGEPTPAELVALLSSADRIEREEAARTLEEMGAEALPALRDVGPTAPEPVRARARSVARIIEGRLYRSVEELERVKWIGKKRREEIRPLVIVE